MAQIVHWQHAVDGYPMCKPVEHWEHFQLKFKASTKDDEITCEKCKSLLEQMLREIGNPMEPTAEDLESPEFNAIWNIIKGWDLQREDGAGYAGATGTDVMTILNALKTLDAQQIANALPPDIVYFAAIKVGAYATTGKYSDTVVPELNFMDAIKRYYNDHELTS